MKLALTGPVVLACAAAASAAVPALAAHGTLTGTITGAPTGATASVVEAVNPQGVIGGVGTVSAAGSYSLSLAPGTWLVTGSALSGDSAFAALTAPLRVRAGRKAHVHAAPLKASKATARGLPVGSVVTFAPLLINDQRGPVFNVQIDYTGVVTNILFTHCASRGITFVDTSETFRKYAQQELALSRAGRLATPFVYKPIKPQFRVETEFNEISRSGIDFGLGVHATNNKEFALDKALEAEERVSRNGPELESDPTDGEALTMVTKVAGILAGRMCG